ncbi:MAG: hypothetical protein LQ352_002083 [Teloschistes flavicans]|nr:MAG: hypothetical protein LQ352_002083 [Teloschistes flavicans]
MSPPSLKDLPGESSLNLESSLPYIGQVAPRDAKFCPLAAVSKWPYRFLHQSDAETISKRFFAAGRFRDRGWTLYYIHTSLPSESKPLILVPADEVQVLFNEIREQLGLIVHWPRQDIAPGFLLTFSEADLPRPQYLGRLDLHHSLDEMEAKIPPHKNSQDEAPRVDDRSLAAFKKKMEDAVQATKQKSKNQKDKKKKNRIGMKQGWCEQMKRAQCYLGLRPRADPDMPNPVQDLNIPMRELEREIKRYNLAQCCDLPHLKVAEAAPFPFQSNVVFICVDVEAYEKPPRPITEIGISTLDTSDLVNIAPGERGIDWMKKIRSRHFRIREHGHLHNSEHVQGCADRFEPDFGVSEWISIQEAPQVIASCFRPPYSRRSKDISGKSQTDDSESKDLQRQLVLVGHDIQNDVEYLRKLGYDVANLSNVIEAVDTADLYRAWKHEQNPTNLGAILLELELVGWNLHNAGNDAAYTLQALLGIAISARLASSNTNSLLQIQSIHRAKLIEREAHDRAQEEAAEWVMADQEGGDGGPPQPLVPIGWPSEKPARDAITKDSPSLKETKMEKGVSVMQSAKERADAARKEEAKREAKTKEEEAAKKEIVSEPWVEEKAETAEGDGDQSKGVVVFEQGITDRLALLNGGGAAVGGGVKLPPTNGRA